MKIKLLAALILGAAALPSFAAPLHFNVSSLGDFAPVAINNVGQMVGYDNGNIALYNGGNLSTLGGRNMVVTGFNDSAEVVGYLTSQTNARQAFIHSNGTLTNIGPANNDAGAWGINNAGQVVGTIGVGEQRHGFVYANGVLTDLNQGQTGEFSGSATAINNQGKIVGTAGEYFWSATPVEYANGATTVLPNSQPDGWTMYASGVSDNGDVLIQGRAPNSQETETFIYTNGALTGLGKLTPTDINASSLVVGNDYNFGVAYLWDSGTLYDVNTLVNPASGWTIQSVTGINDSNMISAWGCRTGSFTECGGLLLSTQAVMPVPEPTTYAMMLGGLGMLGFMARRRRSRNNPA